MAVRFVPLHDRILVRRVEEQETTSAGIIIPDVAKDKPQEGEVLAIGKGKINEDGKVLPWMSKPGIESYSENILAPILFLMVKSISSCVKTRCSA